MQKMLLHAIMLGFYCKFLDNYPNPYTGETYKDLFPNDYSGEPKNADGDEMSFENNYKKESCISNIIRKFYNKEKKIWVLLI